MAWTINSSANIKDNQILSRTGFDSQKTSKFNESLNSILNSYKIFSDRNQYGVTSYKAILVNPERYGNLDRETVEKNPIASTALSQITELTDIAYNKYYTLRKRGVSNEKALEAAGSFLDDTTSILVKGGSGDIEDEKKFSQLFQGLSYMFGREDVKRFRGLIPDEGHLGYILPEDIAQEHRISMIGSVAREANIDMGSGTGQFFANIVRGSGLLEGAYALLAGKEAELNYAAMVSGQQELASKTALGISKGLGFLATMGEFTLAAAVATALAPATGGMSLAVVLAAPTVATLRGATNDYFSSLGASRKYLFASAGMAKKHVGSFVGSRLMDFGTYLASQGVSKLATQGLAKHLLGSSKHAGSLGSYLLAGKANAGKVALSKINAFNIGTTVADTGFDAVFDFVAYNSLMFVEEDALTLLDQNMFDVFGQGTTPLGTEAEPTFGSGSLKFLRQLVMRLAFRAGNSIGKEFSPKGFGKETRTSLTNKAWIEGNLAYKKGNSFNSWLKRTGYRVAMRMSPTNFQAFDSVLRENGKSFIEYLKMDSEYSKTFLAWNHMMAMDLISNSVYRTTFNLYNRLRRSGKAEPFVSITKALGELKALPYTESAIRYALLNEFRELKLLDERGNITEEVKTVIGKITDDLLELTKANTKETDNDTLIKYRDNVRKKALAMVYTLSKHAGPVNRKGQEGAEPQKHDWASTISSIKDEMLRSYIKKVYDDDIKTTREKQEQDNLYKTRRVITNVLQADNQTISVKKSLKDFGDEYKDNNRRWLNKWFENIGDSEKFYQTPDGKVVTKDYLLMASEKLRSAYENVKDAFKIDEDKDMDFFLRTFAGLKADTVEVSKALIDATHTFIGKKNPKDFKNMGDAVFSENGILKDLESRMEKILAMDEKGDPNKKPIMSKERKFVAINDLLKKYSFIHAGFAASEGDINNIARRRAQLSDIETRFERNVRSKVNLNEIPQIKTIRKVLSKITSKEDKEITNKKIADSLWEWAINFQASASQGLRGLYFAKGRDTGAQTVLDITTDKDSNIDENDIALSFVGRTPGIGPRVDVTIEDGVGVTKELRVNGKKVVLNADKDWDLTSVLDRQTDEDVIFAAVYELANVIAKEETGLKLEAQLKEKIADVMISKSDAITIEEAVKTKTRNGDTTISTLKIVYDKEKLRVPDVDGLMREALTSHVQPESDSKFRTDVLDDDGLSSRNNEVLYDFRYFNNGKTGFDEVVSKLVANHNPTKAKAHIEELLIRIDPARYNGLDQDNRDKFVEWVYKRVAGQSQTMLAYHLNYELKNTVSTKLTMIPVHSSSVTKSHNFYFYKIPGFDKMIKDKDIAESKFNSFLKENKIIKIGSVGAGETQLYVKVPDDDGVALEAAIKGVSQELEDANIMDWKDTPISREVLEHKDTSSGKTLLVKEKYHYGSVYYTVIDGKEIRGLSEESYNTHKKQGKTTAYRVIPTEKELVLVGDTYVWKIPDFKIRTTTRSMFSKDKEKSRNIMSPDIMTFMDYLNANKNKKTKFTYYETIKNEGSLDKSASFLKYLGRYIISNFVSEDLREKASVLDAEGIDREIKSAYDAGLDIQTDLESAIRLGNEIADEFEGENRASVEESLADLEERMAGNPEEENLFRQFRSEMALVAQDLDVEALKRVEELENRYIKKQEQRVNKINQLKHQNVVMQAMINLYEIDLASKQHYDTSNMAMLDQKMQGAFEKVEKLFKKGWSDNKEQKILQTVMFGPSALFYDTDFAKRGGILQKRVGFLTERNGELIGDLKKEIDANVTKDDPVRLYIVDPIITKSGEEGIQGNHSVPDWLHNFFAKTALTPAAGTKIAYNAYGTLIKGVHLRNSRFYDTKNKKSILPQGDNTMSWLINDIKNMNPTMRDWLYQRLTTDEEGREYVALNNKDFKKFVRGYKVHSDLVSSPNERGLNLSVNTIIPNYGKVNRMYDRYERFGTQWDRFINNDLDTQLAYSSISRYNSKDVSEFQKTPRVSGTVARLDQKVVPIDTEAGDIQLNTKLFDSDFENKQQQKLTLLPSLKQLLYLVTTNVKADGRLMEFTGEVKNAAVELQKLEAGKITISNKQKEEYVLTLLEFLSHPDKGVIIKEKGENGEDTFLAHSVRFPGKLPHGDAPFIIEGIRRENWGVGIEASLGAIREIHQGDVDGDTIFILGLNKNEYANVNFVEHGDFDEKDPIKSRVKYQWQALFKNIIMQEDFEIKISGTKQINTEEDRQMFVGATTKVIQTIRMLTSHPDIKQFGKIFGDNQLVGILDGIFTGKYKQEEGFTPLSFMNFDRTPFNFNPDNYVLFKPKASKGKVFGNIYGSLRIQATSKTKELQGYKYKIFSFEKKDEPGKETADKDILVLGKKDERSGSFKIETTFKLDQTMRTEGGLNRMIDQIFTDDTYTRKEAQENIDIEEWTIVKNSFLNEKRITPYNALLSQLPTVGVNTSKSRTAGGLIEAFGKDLNRLTKSALEFYAKAFLSTGLEIGKVDGYIGFHNIRVNEIAGIDADSADKLLIKGFNSIGLQLIDKGYEKFTGKEKSDLFTFEDIETISKFVSNSQPSDLDSMRDIERVMNKHSSFSLEDDNIKDMLHPAIYTTFNKIKQVGRKESGKLKQDIYLTGPGFDNAIKLLSGKEDDGKTLYLERGARMVDDFIKTFGGLVGQSYPFNKKIEVYLNLLENKKIGLLRRFISADANKTAEESLAEALVLVHKRKTSRNAILHTDDFIRAFNDMGIKIGDFRDITGPRIVDMTKIKDLGRSAKKRYKEFLDKNVRKKQGFIDIKKNTSLTINDFYKRSAAYILSGKDKGHNEVRRRKTIVTTLVNALETAAQNVLTLRDMGMSKEVARIIKKPDIDSAVPKYTRSRLLQIDKAAIESTRDILEIKSMSMEMRQRLQHLASIGKIVEC